MCGLQGTELNKYYTRSGTSQGSTLGPTQFLMMINDLLLSVRLMFADDLTLFMLINGADDCEAPQLDIDAVAGWADINRLYFNMTKCKAITFTCSRAPLCFIYHLFGTPTMRVQTINDLGLTVGSRLEFRQHFTSTCSRANKTLGFIMRVSSQFKDPGVAGVQRHSLVSR